METLLNDFTFIFEFISQYKWHMGGGLALLIFLRYISSGADPSKTSGATSNKLDTSLERDISEKEERFDAIDEEIDEIDLQLEQLDTLPDTHQNNSKYEQLERKSEQLIEEMERVNDEISALEENGNK